VAATCQHERSAVSRDGWRWIVQVWANESLGPVQESGLKSDILTATSEPDQSMSVSVAMLLLGMGSVTAVGAVTVAVSEIEPVGDAPIMPVAL
jgi:hypothetical protein